MVRLRVMLMLTLLSLIGFAAVAQERPEYVGTIAFIGNDDNVYVMGADHQTVALTTDAAARRRYQFPTWSTDGRLAFFCCDPTFSPDLAVEVFVATPDLTAAKLLYSTSNEGYTYAYWSPANCDAGPTCRDLAVLLTRAGESFKVELIRQNGAVISSRAAGTGAPFYFSWHYNGQRMLWYRNNAQISFFNAAIDLAVEETLDELPGAFQAPSWSPVDDRAAFVVFDDGGRSTSIVVVDGDEREVVVGGIPTSIRGYSNITAFSWSPDGRFIAYRAINRFGASPLFVVDATSGQTIAVTTDANVAAFFWSPDSRRLAYLTLNEGADSADAVWTRAEYQDEAGLFRWSLLDVATGASQPLVNFTPTHSMYYMLSFFDQFSQSHQLWSPDSRYLVYGDSAGGVPLVKVLDTSAASPVPFTLAEGHIGIWSYHE